MGEILKEEYSQQKIEESFKKFSCRRETDLEDFLMHKAIPYENSNLTAFQDDFRTAKPLPDDTDINALIAPGTFNVYTTINGNKYRWILVVDWCNASGVSLSRQTAYYFLGAAPVAPITRYQYNTGSSYNWSQWY